MRPALNYTPEGFLELGELYGSSYPYIVIVSSRGGGKTYSTLKWLVESKQKFIYFRRTDKILNIISDPALHPFKRLNEDLGWNIQPRPAKGLTELVDASEGHGEVIGYMAALSTFSNIRGFDASDIEVMVWDEFIPEATDRIMFNMFTAWSNAIETVNRNRELILPLGTDNFGRDVLKQLVSAAGTSIKIGLIAGSIATLIGLTLGLLSGYLGGIADRIISEILNILMMIPTFFLIILAISLYGSSIDNMILIMALTGWAGTARLMRGQALAIREKTFIKNAETIKESYESVSPDGKTRAYFTPDGYYNITRKWEKGDEVTICFEMQPRMVLAHENVEADHGLVAVERGPLVYCAEWTDNDFDIKNVVINPEAKFTLGERDLSTFIPEERKAQLSTWASQRITTLSTEAQLVTSDAKGTPQYETVNLTLTPYYTWAHRGRGDMKVWLPCQEE